MARQRKRTNRSRGEESKEARRATGERSPRSGLKPGQRWSRQRKREVVLRMLRGESVDELSRELGVEIYRLEQWRERALVGIDESLRERSSTDPLVAERDAALKRVGELSMENELLRQRQEVSRPLARRRLK